MAPPVMSVSDGVSTATLMAARFLTALWRIHEMQRTRESEASRRDAEKRILTTSEQHYPSACAWECLPCTQLSEKAYGWN
jgi:hypothetical protein